MAEKQSAQPEKDALPADVLDVRTTQALKDQFTIADHLVYKKYLQELENYALVKPEESAGGKITDDYIKAFQLEELTVSQGEDQLQKLSTVYHSSMALGCSLAVLVSVKKIGAPAAIYLGVRRNLQQKYSEAVNDLEVSFNTLREGMESNFPGSRTTSSSEDSLNSLLNGAFGPTMRTITSASCVAALRDKSKTEDKAFIQGIERLMDAMGDRVYTALFLAEPVSEEEQAGIRSSYEEMYSRLSPFRKSTWSYGDSESLAVMNSVCEGTSVTETKTESTASAASRGSATGFGLSFSRETGRTENFAQEHTEGVFEEKKDKALGAAQKVPWKKVAVVGGVTLAVGAIACIFKPELLPAAAGAVKTAVGKAAGGAGKAANAAASAAVVEEGLNGRNSFSHGVAEMAAHTLGCSLNHQRSKSKSEEQGKSVSSAQTTSRQATTGETQTNGSSRTLQINFENKSVENLLERIEEQLKRTRESEDYGCYNCSAYFLAPQPETAILAANTYRALMIGEGSAVESGAVNIWQEKDQKEVVRAMREYLKHFEHPVFTRKLWENEDARFLYTPGTLVSGRELPMHLGLPTRSIHGMAVIHHAEFGRNVRDVRLEERDKMSLGKIYHMGKAEENAELVLNRQALTSHTFITGSTGTGKSNAVYHLLDEITRDNEATFLVVEPAKGEYKHVFGNGRAAVYGTNENLTPLLRINPFEFPPEVHVREHIDRLVEIFNACWPMYAAMPAVLKDAVERCYRNVGWNLSRSTNKQQVFPTFFDLMDTLPAVIEESEFSNDTRSDYTGALYTRVRSLTTGIYGSILCAEDGIPDEELFDRNVVVDLSRVSSMETKSLLMGLLVMKLQEHRMCTAGMNQRLKHVTVLEEAHNLLRRTSDVQTQESANLQGKSVEMLTDAIAEMRTYGEGFIIADQSPALLDPAVIRNTNTKLILRLPGEEDRKLVGRSAGLNENQINELAKLDMGVAAVYQNSWTEPVLCEMERYEIPEKGYQRPQEQPSDTERVMAGLFAEKEAPALPREVREHWLSRWQGRTDPQHAQYLNEVLQNEYEPDDEVIAAIIYDLFDGQRLLRWFGKKMEHMASARSELVEQLMGRYQLSEEMAEHVLDGAMSFGLKAAACKDGSEMIRKAYLEQGGKLL